MADGRRCGAPARRARRAPALALAVAVALLSVLAGAATSALARSEAASSVASAPLPPPVEPARASADPATLFVAAIQEPRAFGYRIGDVVARDVRVHVPDGLALDASSLPRTAGRGGALELRRLDRRVAAEAGGQRLDLHLEYQVFLAPAQVRTLELPVLTLAFRGRPRDQDLRVDAWPVTVAPLVPADASPRRGLGELQPDASAPPIDTRAARHRLVAWAVGLSILALYLGHVYIGLPWRARRGRPFEAAWRALRRQPADTAAGTVARSALQRLHAAVNASAGEVVFAHGLDRWLRAQPRFEPLRSEFEAFFERSRREFFGVPNGGGVDRGWLLDLSRRCRDLERGSA